ncbi:MAG: nicotinamide-nucleotide amidohydrolase family protein [Polyangiales bacterium]
MFDEETLAKARAVLDGCRARGWKVCTAESLTGGLIAAALTEVPGSSDVVDRAYVTYSYEAKAQMLGVPYDLVAACGAVSEAVARAMAAGALARSHPCAHLSVAVTGVAGPGPSGANPAGRVHLASAMRGGEVLHAQRDFGSSGRDSVRRATVLAALDLLLARLSEG